MSYFIVFTLGSIFGVTLMCLLQINRMGTDTVPSGTKQREGGPDEQ